VVDGVNLEEGNVWMGKIGKARLGVKWEIYYCICEARSFAGIATCSHRFSPEPFLNRQSWFLSPPRSSLSDWL
jgi:hypothetical protein